MTNKRIVFRTRVEEGYLVYIAMVQMRVLGMWWTVTTYEDTTRWYAQAKAEEALSYLEDERYGKQDRRKDIGEVLRRCCQAV